MNQLQAYVDEIIHSESGADHDNADAVASSTSMLMSLQLDESKADKKLIEDGQGFEEFESSQGSSRRSHTLKQKRIIGIDSAASTDNDQ